MTIKLKHNSPLLKKRSEEKEMMARWACPQVDIYTTGRLLVDQYSMIYLVDDRSDGFNERGLTMTLHMSNLLSIHSDHHHHHFPVIFYFDWINFFKIQRWFDEKRKSQASSSSVWRKRAEWIDDPIKSIENILSASMRELKNENKWEFNENKQENSKQGGLWFMLDNYRF